MKRAYLFPGQGSQFVGMGKDQYENVQLAHDIFELANDILGFRISDVMFDGSEEDLKATDITQPAVFIHSYLCAKLLGDNFQPQAVAGHSLGEFTALVAAQALRFEEGLRLVRVRANAMQKACSQSPSTMAAILGLDDALIESVCAEIPGIVVPANYNAPEQLVIAGEIEAIEMAVSQLTEAGAKKAIVLPVGGAFHSPLMQPAQDELRDAIMSTEFHAPICPIYQNVDAKPHTEIETIRENLISQLTSPVRWTDTMYAMIKDGYQPFIECGSRVLTGLLRRIDKTIVVEHV